ncbi:mannosylglycerate hydrolase MGH1 isoform X2 [Physcomitrium patens]|uniref:mannosylglycerate hydrolase MGH1 isoform X2 n=1 Tax=Physcomitrium patens TaxID=3218 RepID=UPI003CCD2E44
MYKTRYCSRFATTVLNALLNFCCCCVLDHVDEQQTEAYKKLEVLLTYSRQILTENDLGGYTIPAKGLYPYQWNWDSALVAMGWATFDEARAWEEMTKLFSAQWDDGMVSHIVFHKPSTTYFPGPEIWGSVEKPRKSTGITQPPVAAITVHKLYEQAVNKELALTKVRELFPKLLAWHRWFKTARDPENTGLVATLHPWESGMDNSPAWDEPLRNVPVDDIPPYVRADLTHVNSSMRPSQAEYDRFLTLVYRFRAVDYDCKQLYYLSPFRVTDLCTNSVLYRANLSLRWLAEMLGELDVVPEIDEWLEGFRVAFSSLYDPAVKMFKSKDQLTGKLLNASTSAGFLPLFARIATPSQAQELAATLEQWLSCVKYGIPSNDPNSADFEPLRYWRGPIWAIVNWMITDGLLAYGYDALAQRVESDTYELLGSGICEYYDPTDGKPAGGGSFSWTAAMCLAWLGKCATSA